ncbi:MAG TPA: fused MFS/spermidine synthase [bacterium]|nr:fused MFS/spermidine synthase [bacterium]
MKFLLVLLLLVVSVPFGASAGTPGSERVLFEADSIYHHIVVAEDRVARYLRFDRSLQSGMLLGAPHESPFLYAAYAHVGFIFTPQAKRVLVIGLGGASIPKRFLRDYPEITVEVAEIDPMVLDVAKRFFAVRDDPRLRIFVQDGRLFLRRSERKYDMIIIDAFFAESIPFHLTTREFYELARSRLAPGGVIVANLIGALEGPQSSLFRAVYKTYAEVFTGLYLFPIALRPYNDVKDIRNIMLVASAERSLTRTEIMERARRVAPRIKYRDFLKYAGDYYDEPISVDDLPVLTDDYAPVDTLIPLYHWTPVKRP